MSSGEKRRQTNQRYIVATELFGLYFFFLYTNYTPKTSHSVSIKMNMDVLCISVRNGIFKIKCVLYLDEIEDSFNRFQFNLDDMGGT